MSLLSLRILLSTLVAIAVARGPPQRLLDVTEYSFEEYLVEFDKSYDDPVEYNKRKHLFETNVQTIVSHNQQKQQQQQQQQDGKGHWLGINLFTDLEANELPRGYNKHQSTLRRTGGNEEYYVNSNYENLPFRIEPLENLPKAVDWRAAGVTTPVKNQGQCGSCWAFASTAVLESHVALQTGKLITLSEQELVSCAPNRNHCGGNGGCAGSTAELAFDLVARKGIVQEWEFGYQSYHGAAINCTLEDDTPKATGLRAGLLSTGGSTEAAFKGAVATIDGYLTLPSNNYQILMNAVAKFGPVAVSVACLPWHLYQGGVFYAPLNDTRSTDVDHLVVLEGYGTDHMTGEDYFLVRNSWSPMWGEDGYIRLLRVDPSTLEDPDADCGMDTTPSDGVACTKDADGNDVVPPPAKICGNSGILYDTSIPFGSRLMDGL